MEKDLKDIELFIDFCRAPYNFEHESDAKSYKELSNKIEHLIKAYKELKEENAMLKKVNKITENITTEEIENAIKEANKKYIPVALVEEKIEEINEYYKKEIYPSLMSWSDVDITEYYDGMIGILKELLEKRK